ncbi:acetyl-CoA synthetase-like protein [Gloeophyllum trabeum ATCC 11539]|uniref:Acetyl-CoA synthetase-like protein n=1 Tax=Gloeophyllum trabeum (strain ATCC 11539 / FP-39264 / Madison 617) TaxID=670483 RepID=S7RQ37_GLOTA|nr:acetyl-CoA synthetase-like protein [Gloeophyllum trabeum ATCC 11539]EPQ56705.1 acetyl-CoA synthetase-like protein [Gloeophyllum trabeum ATCC 11539]
MSTPLAFLSTLPAPPPGTSLGDQLAEQVTDSGRCRTLLDCLCTTDSPALWSPDAARPALPHRALHEFISSFALPTSGLHPSLGPNDRVMVVLPTGPENALALLALAAYHTCAPVNASCTAAELCEDARRLGAKAVVATPDVAERLELRKLRAALRCEVVFVHARPAGPAGLFDMTVMDESDDDRTWDVVDRRERRPSRLHALDDQSLVLHTSGTSGKKKVVPYSLRSLIVGTCAVIKSWDLQPGDVNMNMMPLFHVGGIVRNLWAPMFSGGSAIMCAGFDASAFWPIVVERGATWYYAAPTMHHAILASRPDSLVPSRDTRMRMIANAAGGLLPTLAAELRRTFGAVILPSYGMTECMPIASPPTTYQLDRPGCSGVACGPYLSIRDPADLERELPTGATGAVCVRGLPTFDGYELAPGAPLDTSAFTREGWFDSGDMGCMDADGYLYITGRSKEIINKGGEVVSPFEIEEAVVSAAKDRVKATLAFSAEHDVLQETIAVVVVPVPGRPRISLADLHDLLKANLHPSKWPFAVVYMDDLPKNNAGKPLRIKLAQRLGLGCLTDDTPALARHFEATAPDKNTPLSEPIPCKRVSLDLSRVEQAMHSMLGVQEVAVRLKKDGSPEALVSVDLDSGLDSASVLDGLTDKLDGYCIPSPLHVLTEPLAKTADGAVDFARIEAEIQARAASQLSPTALVVRDVIARLLDLDPGAVTLDSDFFLLGGNSLLLGRLAHHLRKETGAALQVPAIFTNSSVRGIAALVEEQEAHMSKTALNSSRASVVEKGRYDLSESSSIDLESLGYGARERGSRGQTHPVSLFVQALPLMFFYPLKAAWTWTVIVFMLSVFGNFIDAGYWMKIGCLLGAIVTARLSARIISPVAAILFKWAVIGRYRPGTYPMWGSYHLRWWIVNQSLRVAGRGVFSMHPALELLYYRLLGAKIGRDVKLDKMARLHEVDLLTLHDGCRIDKALVRGFCVERDGFFKLDRIVIGEGAVVNTYTQISPGASIPAGAVYGPHASSHEEAASDKNASCNRTMARKPHAALQWLVCHPVVFLVKFASYLPWFAALFALLSQPIDKENLNTLELVIKWFASPQRIMWHALARVIRVVFPPLIQLVLGIAVKRAMGLNKEGLMEQASQWTLVRRQINHSLLSQRDLSRAFDILGTHYEMTSRVFRAMGAKIGKRVYWPGSGVYCPDPELLEVGDDVVFGSRSELFTSDCIGAERIVIKSGAMIADRVVLLPGTTVGRRTVMGSGALGKRNGVYEDGSVWMGCDHGEAVCFGRGGKDVSGDTITPFGRAFYRREAPFFVFPYPMLLAINLLTAGVCAGFWSMGAIAVTQALNQLRIHLHHVHLFAETWYRFFVLFGMISVFFVAALNIQAWIALSWVILTKWIVIGRRQEGQYDWDKSNYCQRWQLHLVLSRILHRSYGNGGVLGNITGSAYIVWFYRALGAKIGKDVALFAGGRVGLMTEPDLLEIGDRVCLDDCSVVAHINSRGNFSLNKLKIADSSAMRSGSRLLSGASMEENSMLLEHTLLTSGEIAEKDCVYAGWPAKPIDYFRLASYYDLEKHHDELEGEKRRLEEMLQKTEDMMSRVRRGMKDMKGESRNVSRRSSQRQLRLPSNQ